MKTCSWKGKEECGDGVHSCTCLMVLNKWRTMWLVFTKKDFCMNRKCRLLIIPAMLLKGYNCSDSKNAELYLYAVVFPHSVLNRRQFSAFSKNTSGIMVHSDSCSVYQIRKTGISHFCCPSYFWFYHSNPLSLFSDYIVLFFIWNPH